MTDYKTLCAELVQAMTDDSAGCWHREHDVLVKARAALAEPVRTADGEVAKLVAELRCVASALNDEGYMGSADPCRRAADLLTRLAPQRVPEGPSDDDTDDLCAEFGFHYEDEESLALLQEMFRAVLARWGRP